MVEKTVIGIDLGTTYCRVTVFKNERIEVLANEIASHLTPSCVSFTEKVHLVGESAKNQAAMNSENTICGMRRLIGQRYSYNIPGSKYWSFRVTNDEKRAKISVKYRGKSKELCPEQATAMLLVKMRKIAEDQKVNQNAVVTVPAHFNNSQRTATKDAGLVAGLKPALINETTAAALAYVYDKKAELARKEKTVLVYNLGGGFLDVSLMVIKNLQVQVKATACDRALGGEDFDNCLIEYCVTEFRHRHGKDLANSPRAMCRLRKACEKAKRDLSFTVSASIDIDELFEGVDFSLDISRKKFEELCDDLFKRSMIPVMNALYEANFDKQNVDEVLIVGGSTRIPFIQKQLSEYFGERKLNMSMNPDLAAVMGAAVYGGRECQEKTVQDIEFVDMVSSSYGIEVEGGLYEKILKTPNILIKVLQGEKERAKENTVLGEYRLQSTMGSRKQAEVKVVFKVDRNGILTAFGILGSVLSHLELPSERYKLIPGQVADFTRELEQFEEDEKSEKLRVEAKNHLQSSIDKLQQKLDNGKIEVSAREEVRDIQSKIVAWLDTNNNAEKSQLEEIHQRYRERVQEALKRPIEFIDEKKVETAPIPKQYPGTAHLASSVRIEDRPPSRTYAEVTKTRLAMHPSTQQVSFRDTTLTYGVYPQHNPPQDTRHRQHNPYYSTYQASYGNKQIFYNSTTTSYSASYQQAQQQYPQNYGSTSFFHGI